MVTSYNYCFCDKITERPCFCQHDNIFWPRGLWCRFRLRPRRLSPLRGDRGYRGLHHSGRRAARAADRTRWRALPGRSRPAGRFSFRPDEDLEQGAARELAEETGLRPGSWHLEQLATYGTPNRDPRMRVVTVAYWAICADLPVLRSGGDAVAATLTPVQRIESGEISLGVRSRTDRARRGRAGHDPSSSTRPSRRSSAPPEFTIGQLRRVYEAVLEHASRSGQLPAQRPGERRIRKANGCGSPTAFPSRAPRLALVTQCIDGPGRLGGAVCNGRPRNEDGGSPGSPVRRSSRVERRPDSAGRSPDGRDQPCRDRRES